jgi:hypothetical protein
VEDFAVSLGAEIAKVQTELRTLRDEYLPVFVALPLAEAMPEHSPDFVRARAGRVSHRLSSWQQAVTRLSDTLPIANKDEYALSLSDEDFSDFMFQEATPSFSVITDGIRWKIGLFTNMNWVRSWCWPPCLERKDNIEDEEQDLLAMLPKIKEWLLGLAIDGDVLLNAACMVLPIMADVDPPFVKLALDPQTWRSMARANATVSEETRQKWIDHINHGRIRHAMHNALLHVFGSLANNHFLEIGDYLDHPYLYGSYTGLMPHYLFAVLYQKVSILRQLARDRPTSNLTGPHL